MSVNSISSLSGGGSFFGCIGGSNLSEETKRKLRQLGIEPSTITSEMQAQTLITKIEQKLQQVNKSPSASNTQKITTGEAELIAKAKALASQMDISVSSSDSISDILGKISAKIKSSQGKNNNLNQEFETLQSEYSNIEQKQNTMFNAMNYTANLNKYMLGLN